MASQTKRKRTRGSLSENLPRWCWVTAPKFGNRINYTKEKTGSYPISSWFFVPFGAVHVLKLVSLLQSKVMLALLNFYLLIALVLLTVLSYTPLFRWISITFWTASLFLFMPAANSLKVFRSLFMALSTHLSSPYCNFPFIISPNFTHKSIAVLKTRGIRD